MYKHVYITTCIHDNYEGMHVPNRCSVCLYVASLVLSQAVIMHPINHIMLCLSWYQTDHDHFSLTSKLWPFLYFNDHTMTTVLIWYNHPI